ncbi:MAG: PfkB family carbohydrate kinase, partial [Thermostichales cyanobacterium BF4_bins_65]
ELLFDLLPDGQAVPGGAPFIVAWHLRGFGLDPLLISAVGEDAYGEQMLEILGEWGLDLAGIQRCPTAPTGTVQVSLDQGQPTFFIPPDLAFDHVAPEPALAVATAGSLLYHGTLALRQPQARDGWRQLRATLKLPVLLDVNLRDPYWDRPFLLESVRGCQRLKLNQTEFAILMGMPPSPQGVQQLCRDYGLASALVTLGSQGAILGTAEQVWLGEPVPVRQLADTVGAGDAFTSVWIVGTLLGWQPQVILQRGLAFAARMCENPGGTTRDRQMYGFFRQQWGLA